MKMTNPERQLLMICQLFFALAAVGWLWWRFHDYQPRPLTLREVQQEIARAKAERQH